MAPLPCPPHIPSILPACPTKDHPAQSPSTVAATATPGDKGRGQISSLLCPNLHSAPKTALKAALLMPQPSLTSPLTSHSFLPTALAPLLHLKALLPTSTRLSPSAPPHPLKSHISKEVSFRPCLAPHSPSCPGGVHGHSGLQCVLHLQRVTPTPRTMKAAHQPLPRCPHKTGS